MLVTNGLGLTFGDGDPKGEGEDNTLVANGFAVFTEPPEKGDGLTLVAKGFGLAVIPNGEGEGLTPAPPKGDDVAPNGLEDEKLLLGVVNRGCGFGDEKGDIVVVVAKGFGCCCELKAVVVENGAPNPPLLVINGEGEEG